MQGEGNNNAGDDIADENGRPSDECCDPETATAIDSKKKKNPDNTPVSREKKVCIAAAIATLVSLAVVVGISGRRRWYAVNLPDCGIEDGYDSWGDDGRGGMTFGTLGDGKCDGGAFNVEECAYDRGDCTEFNAKYPACEEFQNSGYGTPHSVGNGQCNKQFNVVQCGYDGGDCDEFNRLYPLCDFGYPEGVGDGVCRLIDFGYHAKSCGFDGGDCAPKGYPECNVYQPENVGNGVCDNDLTNYWQYSVPAYNSLECGFDGGDCLAYNKKYPNCNKSSRSSSIRNPDPLSLGDGICNQDYNTQDCLFDGGDCTAFNANFPNCTSQVPQLLGDGNCNSQNNSEECGYDDGDCDELNAKYPDCEAASSEIGNGSCYHGCIYRECDKSIIEYNTEACGYDGGDCLEWNNKTTGFYDRFPDCEYNESGVYLMYFGDGVCHDFANIEECGYDLGDCDGQ
eukprot:CAMPEP_0194323532 /NCGR_PEP_ID=MMETSP0171-20130528/25803_1 /TAXON_ID=218684 /ORGANISM="Corethron pennatum, Strain L29A3" /LENGTH=453 /DNA_ID=CAMNT_0039082197 /DNA_START=42 /DNA_END=1403 /DNA_ORIENTATION=-